LTKAVVVVPTYNEEANIRELLDEIFRLALPLDVLIVDDNSPDQTQAIIESMQETYPDRLHLYKREGKRGLGTAYIEGFRWALKRDYEFIFEMDADFSHNPKDLEVLYHTCQSEDQDLVIGSRYVTGVNVVNWPMGRVLLSFLASKYVGFVTGMPLKDTTAGFACFRRSVLETIDLDKIKFKGYAFQIEMKFATWQNGFSIREVPIIFTDRSRGESKMSKGIFREALLGVVEMRIKNFFGHYRFEKPSKQRSNQKKGTAS
jgi:dolichol-phosphate mannosyltransferase